MPSGKESARALALLALERVEKDHAYLDKLKDHLLASSGLNQKERNLFMELSYGVIRHRRMLDFYLEQFLDRKIQQTDLRTRNILRLGAYQILMLDRIPSPAAVNESVKLSAHYAKPLVNAVLRRLSANKNALNSPERIPDFIKRLGIKYSHPDWMVESAIKLLGEKEAEELLSANNQRPLVALRVNTSRISSEELLARFAKEGISAEAGRFCPVAVSLKEHKPVWELPGYNEGWFAVQDEASQLVVLMLDPKPGEEILDACSAPGTKSLFIFQLMKTTGRLVSADINGSRLNLINKEARRLGLDGVEILCHDLTKPIDSGKKEARLFDKILLDAPCSGLGTIRKHPEIKWHRKPEDISQLACMQIQLLQSLAGYLKPGGVMVYSTCTWTKEENEDVVRSLLERGGFELEDPSEFLPDSAKCLVKDRVFRTLPNRHLIDGFSAFRLRKR